MTRMERTSKQKGEYLCWRYVEHIVFGFCGLIYYDIQI